MWNLVILIMLCCLHGVLSNNPPILNVPNNKQVREDTPVGSFLFSITATDPDGDSLTFSITSPTTDELVSLVNQSTGSNPKTADVILKKKLDRDFESATRNLEFTVTDSTYTTPATVLLIILDVNDEPPKFVEPGYRVNVKESEVTGQEVCTVTAIDPDTGSGGQVYYGLKAKGQSPEVYLYTFIIGKSSGKITLNESLDYEERTFYQYNVTAWDTSPDEAHAENHADPVEFFVTVMDVQDTPPFFTNLPYIHTIDENATVGLSVMKVQASDGDLGVPNPIKYFFVEGDDDSDSFALNADHGDITTTKTLDADSQDMKQKGGVLSFRVNASEVFPPDQEQLGDTSTTTRVTINIRDINDNHPTFTSGQIIASVFENTPPGVPLTLNHTVEVEDIDMTSVNNLFELFVEKNGMPYMDFDTVPGANQPVSRTNIMIRVNNTELLDYEQRQYVTFKIAAKESQSLEKLSGTADVTVHIINVNDNSPVFNRSVYNFNISEDANINDVVGEVFATDADLGTFGEVSYEMEDDDADFNISKSGGQMTVARKLDREKKSSYSLLVLAKDNDNTGRRTGQTRVEIRIDDINDNPPIFVGNTLTIPLVEDLDIGDVVTTVSATDEDEGMNAEIEYYIKDDQNITGRFAVNVTTGVLTIKDSLVGYTGLRFITVEARDKGQPPLSGNQTLIFSIRDVNLHPPNFTRPAGDFNLGNRFHLFVLEEEPIGSTMYFLEATDDDLGENGRVSYEMDSGLDSNMFRVNTTTGRLWNNVRLDRESEENYQLQVSARDGGHPALRTTLPITVSLLDIDDNDPYFPDSEHEINVLEETTGCSGVHLNIAKDKDKWENNTRRCYYIQGGDQPYTQYFTLNTTTGAVCLTQKLDREKKDLINILIKVSKHCSLTSSPDKNFDENFNKSDRSLLHVKAKVLDINDNPPVFNDNGKLSTGILYDTPVGEIIFHLREEVTDADEGSNAVTYFRDLGQTGSDIDVEDGAFNVSNNGSVTTNRLFSSTMLGYVEIAVEGYDIGNLTARATLKIYIISNIQRVKIIFNKQPDEVRKLKTEFIRDLEEFLDFTVVVEKIASHELPDKSTVDGRTDMFIHALYKDTGEYVPATELWRAFDFTQGIAAVFSKYGVTETRPVVDDEPEDDNLSRTLTMGLILVATVLSLIALSLAISLYCMRQKYARRLRAERTAATHIEKEEAPPGTNLYTASNPLYMKQAPVIEEVENDDVDLDDNVVDYAVPEEILDEQEMTIDIDSPDALRTMNRNSVLDSVLSQYAEISKQKGDKQSLIDEQGSDADSGTYTSVKGLEQSDI